MTRKHKPPLPICMIASPHAMGRLDRFFCLRRTTAGQASWDHGRSPSGRWRRWERHTSLPGSSADWSSWKVIGGDLAENMPRETAMEIQRRNFPQATVLQMDAEHLAFAPIFFDAVLCGFAVFLF